MTSTGRRCSGAPQDGRSPACSAGLEGHVAQPGATALARPQAQYKLGLF